MNIDFPLILSIAVLVTGACYFLDLLLLAPKRNKAVQEYKRQKIDIGSVAEDAAAFDENAGLDAQVIERLQRQPKWLENASSMFPVLLLVLVLRSFLYEPFQIPSGSMLPTLKIGDFILVNKFDYGLRLPVLGTKFIPLDEPKRGDVMVFKVPEQARNRAFGRGGAFIGNAQAQQQVGDFGGLADQGPDYIKRVIGLPGDQIEYRNKQLFINGEPVPQKLVGRSADVDGSYTLYQETLGGQQYTTQVHDFRSAPDGRWTVPAGYYFMVGDNRDNSLDSRYWGFVPEAYIVGHATYIWMHWPSWTQLPSFRNNGPITP